MEFRCENLDVYKKSRLLVVEAYKITKRFPQEEKFGLVSQLRRAAVSIPLNIAEGSGKHTKKDFAHYIRTAIGSVIEVDTALKISQDLSFISEEVYTPTSDIIKETYFKLIALDKSLRK